MTPVTKTNYLIELNKTLELALKVQDIELQNLIVEQIKLVLKDEASTTKK